MDDERPTVKCFIARPVTDARGRWIDGQVTATPIVEAFEEDAINFWRRHDYIIVGPDPVGMAAVAKWDREHE